VQRVLLNEQGKQVVGAIHGMRAELEAIAESQTMGMMQLQQLLKAAVVSRAREEKLDTPRSNSGSTPTASSPESIPQSPFQVPQISVELRQALAKMFHPEHPDLHAGFLEIAAMRDKDPQAAILMGLCCLEGIGAKICPELACEILQPHQDSDTRAKALLATYYYAKNDFDKGNELLSEALRANDAYAHLAYSRYHLTGTGAAAISSPETACEALSQSASLLKSDNHLDAPIVRALVDVELIRCWQRVGGDQMSEIRGKIKRIYKSAIPAAWYAAAVQVLSLDGMDEAEREEANRQILRAANAKYLDACKRVAAHYVGTESKLNASLAFQFYFLAAAQGDLESQEYVADACYRGVGTTQNYGEAYEWYKQAASQGSLKARLQLGIMHFEGKGVQQSYYEAFDSFSVCASAGMVGAFVYLGECYAQGYAVEPNLEQAIQYYERGAQGEDSRAQYKLGMCYYHGEGLDQDQPRGLDWLKKSASQGNSDAIEFLKTIKEITDSDAGDPPLEDQEEDEGDDGQSEKRKGRFKFLGAAWRFVRRKNKDRSQ